jgi:serine carboxypeptidase-like clade 1
LALLGSFVHAAVDADLVKSLPGYPGQLPQKHYSGFIPSDDAETVFLHYWFIESSNNPSTDPLLVWLNGGPGCSSLDGLFSELGPLHFNGSTTNGVPDVVDNPYAWTKVANVIFLESPAGVGFSYTKNGSTTTNDEITSQNNYGFLKNWFKAYPEYSTNDFYITGESYAGIYTPTFGQRIWEGKQSGDNNINFKGIAAGNGCIGNAVGTCAMYNGGWDGVGIEMEFLHGHAMISEPHWEKVVMYCGNFSDPNPSQQCQDAVNDASNDGGDYNIYDIYDTCPSPVSAKELKTQTAWTEFLRKQNRRLPAITKPQTPDVCTGTEPATWLNLPAVQKALHVDQVNASWSICAGIGYEKTLDSALPAYKGLVDHGYYVLIYSGDVDACVPYVGSERWTANLGYAETDAWQPWTINDQVAGYVTYYEKQFTFLTVKGAGHMVPEYQPEAALNMIQRYLAGGKF